MLPPGWRNEGAKSAFFCVGIVALTGCGAVPVGSPHPSGPGIVLARDEANSRSVALSPLESRWGIDAALTRHVPDVDFPQYLDLLRSSGVKILRERDVGSVGPDGSYDGEVRDKLKAEKAAGFHVVAFASPANQFWARQVGNALPEDLLTVFAFGRQLARDFAGLVDAWELVGEPDVGYCTDLPDRVVAYQKALYLGIKKGSSEHAAAEHPGTKPAVLMGALALPPGPWLRRAAANGLLSYTDAYNFHFYGHAADLPGVISAHERAAHTDFDAFATSAKTFEFTTVLMRFWSELRRVWAAGTLPLWITECGINAVQQADFMNPARRQLQAQFTLETAKRALAAKSVGVFMPFILVHKQDPHAMSESPARPLPAWSVYEAFTLEHPWPNRRLLAAPEAPNPVVLQWLPDNNTTEAHKVSGTYRWKEISGGNAHFSNQYHPIQGQLRLYNFSAEIVRGRIKVSESKALAIEINAVNEIEIAPMSMQVISVAFMPRGAGRYINELFQARFVDRRGRASAVAFGLETPPRDVFYTSYQLSVQSAGTEILHPMQPTDRITERGSFWLGVNGAKIEEFDLENGRYLSAQHVSEAIHSKTETLRLRMWLEQLERDPLKPRMAVARIGPLPREGMIRLRLDRRMDHDFSVCIDLLDKKGQRFTIWENFGVSYFHPESTEIWLNLADFHPYFWGRCTENPTFHPEDVEEIQIRRYGAKPEQPRTLELSVMVPRT